MPSPFPGMDPYLEAHWGDIHHSLVQYARDQLQPVLPDDLRARVEERVVIDTSQGVRLRHIVPDVRVVERTGRAVAAHEAAAGVAVAEPLVIHVADEPLTEGYLEIREKGPGGRVITVVEILSPTNKFPGEAQNKYLEKQHQLKSSGVNLVEIDLLRAGRRVVCVPPELTPASHRTTYQVCVRRGARPGDYEIYRVPLREPLPVIRVPLRDSDADAHLALQPLIEQAYVNGGYEGDIDYSRVPDPPLDSDDAAWADELLRARGLR